MKVIGLIIMIYLLIIVVSTVPFLTGIPLYKHSDSLPQMEKTPL